MESTERKFSAAAQVIHVLRKSSVPLDSHAIYVATSIPDSQTCCNVLNNMANKLVVLRDRENDKSPWQYRINDGAGQIPDRIAEELLELEQHGMPDVQRHIGPSWAEYRSKDKEEKRTLKRTRAVTVSETHEEVCEVEVPQSWVQESIVKSQPAPAIAQESALVVAEQQSAPPQKDAVMVVLSQQELLRLRFEAARDKAQAKLDAMFLMMELVGGGERLSELLNDYAEMLHGSGAAETDDVCQERADDAEKFAAAIKAVHTGVFARIAKHLTEWHQVTLDCGEEGSTRWDRDAKEISELLTMLGHPIQPKEPT
jgi:hypothetical protein